MPKNSALCRQGPRAGGAAGRPGGISLIEILVVVSILAILLSVLAPALGVFAHTARVQSAADTLARFFAEARNRAISRNVAVAPVILTARDGRHTAVYADKVMNFRGVLAASTDAQVFAPPAALEVSQPWALCRQSVDAAELRRGAFVFWIGTPTLDLNLPNDPQPFYELMYMRVTPRLDENGNADPRYSHDSAQYTYEIVCRGVHNTARGQFDRYRLNMGSADVYAVAGGTDAGEALSSNEARDYTLQGIGINLPDHIAIDQVLDAEGRVCGTATAQAALFRESGGIGGKFEPPNYYPAFLPIFMPDGTVSTAVARNSIGTTEADRAQKSGYRDQTVRVMDALSREARYITIRSGGQVLIRRALPPRCPANPFDPWGYNVIYPPAPPSPPAPPAPPIPPPPPPPPAAPPAQPPGPGAGGPPSPNGPPAPPPPGTSGGAGNANTGGGINGGSVE